MKALLIGNRERFIKFDPHTPFSDTGTKVFLGMEDLRAPLPADVLDADFVAADAIAPEPVSPDHPLLHLPKEAADRLVFSPHIGGVTSAVFKRAHKNIWKAFEDIAIGATPQNIVTCDRPQAT